MDVLTVTHARKHSIVSRMVQDNSRWLFPSGFLFFFPLSCFGRALQY